MNSSANVFCLWISIIKTGLPILVELIDLVNSNNLTQMVNAPARIPDCDPYSPALLDFFLSSDASICSTTAFPPLGNPQSPLTFHHIQNGMPCFLALLMAILVLIGMVFVII